MNNSATFWCKAIIGVLHSFSMNHVKYANMEGFHREQSHLLLIITSPLQSVFISELLGGEIPPPKFQDSPLKS